MEERKLTSFTDLQAWQEGHRLVVMVYEKTKDFPRQEDFVLTSQLRRAAISVTSNIAEGFTRQSVKEKVHFYAMAHASLSELQSQLLVARDVGYSALADFDTLAQQSVKTHKLIGGLIRATKQRVLTT